MRRIRSGPFRLPLEPRYDRSMAEPLTRYAKTTDGLHIAYQVVGDGPFDLVYAPAWISNLEYVWDMPDLGDFLRDLAGVARLIVLDRRGSGLSDRPFTADALSLEVGMDDIRAVMDAVGTERAVLFGFEDGGALCTLFAASYPDRVLALVLFGVWAKYGASADYPWGWTEDRVDDWIQLVERVGEQKSSGKPTLTSSRPESGLIPIARGHGRNTRACPPLREQP